MFRFDAKKAFYFYPEATDLEEKELRLNRGSSFEDNVVARDDVSLIKHGLKTPRNTINYQDFEIKIKNSEIEFMKLFNMVGGKKV